jgi:hypothetical protein
MSEGTTAGMAAGILARKIVDEKKVTTAMKKLKLMAGTEERDLALVDAAVVTEPFIGARALWDMQRVNQIFLTQAEPGSIGLSSIGAALRPVRSEDPLGLWVELGPEGEEVHAPIAPGLILAVEVKSYRVLKPGERVSITLSPSILALDGEREVEVNNPDRFELVLGMDGPRVASIPKIMREAAKKGFFRVGGKWRKGDSHGPNSRGPVGA